MSSSSELLRAALAEVTPPGYEHVVKGLKKNPAVDNPWAVCLVGDTSIPCLDGSTRTIKEIAEASRDFWLYSIDVSGLVVPGLSRARFVGVKPVVAITLDNGAVLRCSPEHRWVARDGAFVAAVDLKSGDSLMPFRVKHGASANMRRQGRTDHERVYHPGLAAYSMTHWAVMRAINPGGCAAGGFEIHHRDGNERNNEPENLEWLSRLQHGRAHVEKLARGRETLATRFADPEFAKAHAEKARRSTSAYWASLTPEEKDRRAAPLRARAHAVGMLGGRPRKDVAANHVVVSVERLAEFAPMYDVAVDGWHTFAVSAGVFSHNSWWMKGQGIRPHKAKAKKAKEGDGTPTVTGKITEALPLTGVAALMRPAQMTAGQLQGSPAPVVPNTSIAFPAQAAAGAPPFPIQSFRDDVKRKEGIFASMHPGMGLQPKDVVNYRYSEDPKKACGVCAHYSPDGSCEKVIGMIRAVDTCDLWEPKTAQSDAMKALTQRLQQQQAPPPQPQVQAPAPAGTGVPAVRAQVIATEAGTPEGARKGWETRKGGGGGEPEPGAEPKVHDPDDDLPSLGQFPRLKKPLTEKARDAIASAMISLDFPGESMNAITELMHDPSTSIPDLYEIMNNMPLLAAKLQPAISMFLSSEDEEAEVPSVRGQVIEAFAEEDHPRDEGGKFTSGGGGGGGAPATKAALPRRADFGYWGSPIANDILDRLVRDGGSVLTVPDLMKYSVRSRADFDKQLKFLEDKGLIVSEVRSRNVGVHNPEMFPRGGSSVKRREKFYKLGVPLKRRG